MAKTEKPKKKRRKNPGIPVMGMFSLFVAVVFMPTTILLFFGLLPSLAAVVIDRTRRKTKALTVGAMNFAGCTPFLLQLWSDGHSVERAMEIISDPRTIIVIYCAAGIGYLIEWAMSGIVRSVLLYQAEARLEQIARRKVDLVEKWGREVTGDVPLNADGFPLETDDKTI